MCGIPRQTQYRFYERGDPDEGLLHSYNQNIEFQVPYKALNLDATAVFSVFDCSLDGDEILIGRSTVPLFGKGGYYRKVRVCGCVSGCSVVGSTFGLVRRNATTSLVIISPSCSLHAPSLSKNNLEKFKR